MPRKRLRSFLDAVISDDDLRTSAERVAEPPSPPSDPALTVVAPEAAEPVADMPAAFPSPPWERPPALAPLPNAEPTPAGNGNAATHAPAAVELPAATTWVVSPAVSGDPALPEPASPTASEPAPETPPHPARTDEAPAALLIGAAAEGTHAGRRRRRSATLLPPLPSPTDVPEDAAGRVAIFAVPDPAAPPAADGDRAHSAPDITPAPVVPVGGDAPLAGWLPVLALGVALVVIFVIGVLVTR